jgi:transcriptional regulator with PAS, ATPase and Fis domain
VAHAHDLSRGEGPFVAVNCAAIQNALLESEIFGHEKGAFTGALERRPGCFELAHEGTIFLDEIAEMNPGTQAKFLRILQDGAVRRLGGRTEIRVDVRVLAATNKDPVKAIQEGTFREDLYYRLNVVSLALPPLRERRDDIPALVQAFIEEFNTRYDKQIRSLDETVLNGLIAQSWPGNVRELRNTLERAIIVCEGDTILPKHIPADLRVADSATGDSVSLGTPGGRGAVLKANGPQQQQDARRRHYRHRLKTLQQAQTYGS